MREFEVFKVWVPNYKPKSTQSKHSNTIACNLWNVLYKSIKPSDVWMEYRLSVEPA